MFLGELFTEDFLQEGILETQEWNLLSNEQFSSFEKALEKILKDFPIHGTPNEAQTEQDLIFEILKILGWEAFLPQQTASKKRRTDIPDVLLFENIENKQKANQEKTEAAKYKHGLSIVESKPWNKPLDKALKVEGLNEGVPSTQILRYLSAVEVQSNKKILWGILTNGRHWRLYWQKAQSRSEQFLELDLAAILQLEGFKDLLSPPSEETDHWLKIFFLMFRCDAFLQKGVGGRTFHDLAVEEGKLWEEKVAEDISKEVFETVFPAIVKGLYETDPEASPNPGSEYLGELKEAALVFLYRVLFILYAEDRNLLPAREARYDDYGMRLKVRQDIKQRIDKEDVFAEKVFNYYNHLNQLSHAINSGESSLGLPPYNGGLFNPGKTPLLERAMISDAILAPALDALSRHAAKGSKKWVNYRDLSVQQLGSIYERLLEREIRIENNSVKVELNPFARKSSGSYYTPESLVRLLLERTLSPLLQEKFEEFQKESDKLRKKNAPKKDRLKLLRGYDPAVAFANLKVCDPAMGSGHFLVSLVDFLADQMLEATAKAESLVDWVDAGEPYQSPLLADIETIRQTILKKAEEKKWVVSPKQLEDRQIVRRIILKRVVYGVDKNPMAVELAKVSLWLHTFTVGAPLSFLDHHLRCGDSLFGEWVRPLELELQAGGELMINRHVTKARQAAKGMGLIESLTDVDIAEVKESASEFSGVEDATQPLHDFMSLMHAFKWLEDKSKASKAAIQNFLDGTFGDPVAIASGKTALPLFDAEKQGTFLEDLQPDQLTLDGKGGKQGEFLFVFRKLFERAKALIEEEHFLNWEPAFPGVWDNWENAEPEGGFDVVIGNPPWDRIKMQEVEWFAARKPEIAKATKGSDRKKMVAALKKAKDPLFTQYEKAVKRAENEARVARTIGHYPLLSGGDTNIYSLFIERALHLVKPHGLIGLLVPSGISGDKGASKFFKSISTSGRLESLFDFENKKIFFPEVHASFKFSTFVAGGEKRKFEKSNCAFFLHSTEEINDKAFALSPKDFEAVNPNTGTAPIFRAPKDAEITKAIYKAFPVLVDRRTDPLKKVWPVKYCTMFHMTNDSALFKTGAELKKEGFYIPDGKDSIRQKGKEIYIPLYEGKMVQAYDHRAANITINLENINRPAQPEPATEEQHSNPKWVPTPQFWVSCDKISIKYKYTISFKDVTAPTNVRTMIASLIPFSGVGNTLPLILFDEKELNGAPLLVANLNSIILDFIARQKVQGQHLNWFIVEQLPIIPPKDYKKKFGKKNAEEIVREEVLKLTFTAWDMEPFARDMGYKGKPFIWDEEERRHSRARLDALYFLLYGISRDDADYILSTFSIVKKNEEKEFGKFAIRDLILGYMAAFEAGDTETKISE